MSKFCEWFLSVAAAETRRDLHEGCGGGLLEAWVSIKSRLVCLFLRQGLYFFVHPFKGVVSKNVRKWDFKGKPEYRKIPHSSGCCRSYRGIHSRWFDLVTLLYAWKQQGTHSFFYSCDFRTSKFSLSTSFVDMHNAVHTGGDILTVRRFLKLCIQTSFTFTWLSMIFIWIETEPIPFVLIGCQSCPICSIRLMNTKSIISYAGFRLEVWSLARCLYFCAWHLWNPAANCSCSSKLSTGKQEANTFKEISERHCLLLV